MRPKITNSKYDLGISFIPKGHDDFIDPSDEEYFFEKLVESRNSEKSLEEEDLSE